MTPLPISLRSLIAGARSAVRRDAATAASVAVLTVLPVALLTTWLLSFAVSVTHHVPLIVDALAFALAIGLALLLQRRWVKSITERAVARAAETRHGMAEGELQGVLEMSDAAPAGTSNELLRRAERDLAARLSAASPGEIAGGLASMTRARRGRTLAAAGALFAMVALLAFAAPGRSRAAWSPLLRPVATIAASALPPLAVQPGDTSVARGSSVEVVVAASARAAVVLYWRAQGDVLHEESMPVRNAEAAGRITNVDAPVRYWARAADGARTDTFTITPIDPLLVSALSIAVVYPAYLQRASEHFEKDVPPLELPLGSELRIVGRSTRPLARGALLRASERVPLQVAGSRFTLTWAPRTSGLYAWQLASHDAAEPAALPAPLDIKVIPDAPPQLQVTYPGVDTLLPGDMKQLLVADASDDHAIVAATVVSWRTSATGERGEVNEQPLSLEGEADRKLIRGVLDATSRRLLPGDTLSYFVRVSDNAPTRQVTTSRTYTLRVPGMEEMRERAHAQAEDLVKDADAVAKAMQQLETRTRELQRKTVGGGARSGQQGSGGAPGTNEQKQLSSEQAAQAKDVLKRQDELTGDVQQLRDRIAAMERAAEQAGLRDPELQKRMAELRDLYDQLLSPELKKQMQALQQALDKLDPEQVQKALEELAKQQAELREKLDQSLDLMRRAAAEQEMTKLAQEARELATQQHALAQEMKSSDADTARSNDKQKEISKKTEELGASLLKLKKRLSEHGESDAAEKTGTAQQQASDAQDEMSQATRQAAQNQADKAGQSGQQAAGKLDDAAQTLDDARKQMADGWKKDVQKTVDNATQDAINLAEIQKQLLDRMQLSKQIGDAQQQQQQQGGQQLTPSPGQQQGQKEGKQSGASKDKGQQQGGKAGSQGQGQKQGGQQGSSGAAGQPGASQNPMQQMRSDQAAVKQGLEQLGKNLQEAGQRSAMVNRDVGAALARANLSMAETMKALEQASRGNMPQQQAGETLDALNRLALELIKNGEQIEQSETGTGLQQALKELAELAKRQGNINGRSNSLLPLNLGPKVMAQQLGALAREQRDLADKLGGMNKGGNRDDLLGRLDDLVKEANDIARDLEGGRLAPQTLQRQSELFHKLLDAGRTMERDEVSEERKAEAAQPLPPSVIRALRPGLFDNAGRYTPPTPEQLKDLPPAYRRLILEYFQKLNAAEVKEPVR